MKKVIFIMLMLIWISCVVQAAPQGDGRNRPADKIDDIENEVRIVLERVSPSLVKVVAENARKYVATGISLERGLIITSSLVTRHPFEKISVETSKGEMIVARIAGQDDRSGLTLLRLDKSGPPPLPQSSRAEIGSWVALIGLFYDRFPAIFQGMVSSLSENELILNAPVAPGSAGGAVVNKKGELLGIIRGSIGFSFTPDFTFRDHSASIVVSGSKNESGSLCYAIPIGQVRRIAEKLKTTGKISPGWLGINFSGGSNRVYEVLKESPAAKAGIIRGDRIEEIGGKPIASFYDIVAALEFRQAGEKIGLMVKRAGKPLRFEVELGEHLSDLQPPLPIEPPDITEIPESALTHLAEQLSEIPEIPDLGSALPRVRNYVISLAGSRQLGIDVMEITADLGQKFGVKEGYGLLVSRINVGSTAKKVGLKAGDVIVRANGAATRSTSDLWKILNSLKEKEAVLLELYRDAQLRKFSLVPDKDEKMALDIRQFSQKMENLKDSISDEAKLMFRDEMQKMRQSRGKALEEMQKQRQRSLQGVREESRKLATELKTLQAESDKLASETKQRIAVKLKRVEEELKRIQEEIKKEGEGKPAEEDSGR